MSDATVRGLGFSAWAYARLWTLMSRPMKRLYRDEAVQVFRDLYRSEYRRAGLGAVVLLWRRSFVQVIWGGITDWWFELTHGGGSGPGFDLEPGKSGFRDRLTGDVRFALRTYRNKPVFFVTTVGILALGVAATTTIFSAADGVLFRSLPYEEPEELIFFENPSHQAPVYREWQERLTAFESLAAARHEAKDLTNEGVPIRVHLGTVTPSFFSMFGAAPELGRLFGESDVNGPPSVAVLSYEFWQQRWSGDASVIGRTLEIEGRVMEVIGVLERDFQLPGRMFWRGTVDVWAPLDVNLADIDRRTLYVLSVAGRLESADHLEVAREQMNAWEEWAAREFPEQHVSRRTGEIRRVPLVPLHEATVSDVSKALQMLLGAVALMLLIACANVANLVLAQGSDRSREIALRGALGAGRGRIVGQFLTESILLALIGGALGVGLAYGGVELFKALEPGELPRIDQVSVNLRVLGFALAISVGTGVLFGMLPAFYASRTDVNEALKDASGRSTAGRGRLRLKSTLVVAEIALALVLLVGAGLLFNSFVRLTNVETGFETEQVLALSLWLGDTYEDGDNKRTRFGTELLERIRSVPGVQSAAAAVNVPFGMNGRCCWSTLLRTSTVPGQGDSTSVMIHPVSSDFFETIGATMTQGRDFGPGDVVVGAGDRPEEDQPPSVVILSDSAAHRLLPDQSPVGQTVYLGSRTTTQLRVVGVVRDLKHWSLGDDRDADIYVPREQFGEFFPFLKVIVKIRGDQAAVIEQMRDEVWALDPKLPVPEVEPLATRVKESVAGERFLSSLLVTFAILAVLLAAGGIYGAMLYSVSQRNREFGIRLALGADNLKLLRQVVVQGARLTAVGLVLGLAGAWAASKVLESMVFGITVRDVPTYGAVAALLGAVGILACYLPARRAAATDPMQTLRAE